MHISNQTFDYIHRVNQVIDYIDINLNKKLTLQELSRIANFSEFHFHRIFKSIVHEPLNKYVQRVRIEKAAVKLIYLPEESITKIAFDCGFSSSQFFSSSFKKRFNISPAEWRRNNSKKMYKKSKDLEDYTASCCYIGRESKKERLSMVDFSIEVKVLPSMDVAYIRHIGAYKGNSELFKKMFVKLFKWSGARDLLNEDTKVIALYNDISEITDENKLRLTACITIPDKTETDGVIGKLRIAGGKYAVAHFELRNDEFENAWDMIYSKWLPESGYIPDDKPPFELYYNDPDKHIEMKNIVDICIPVIPL